MISMTSAKMAMIKFKACLPTTSMSHTSIAIIGILPTTVPRVMKSINKNFQPITNFEQKIDNFVSLFLLLLQLGLGSTCSD